MSGLSLVVLASLALVSWAEMGEEMGGPHQADKRFYSWEGTKRRDHSADKRKFYAWAGKRSGGEEEGEYPMEEPEPENQAVAKRKAFYAWAGKRSLDKMTEEERELEKSKFDAFANQVPVEMAGSGPAEKRKFYAWAGKRADKRKFYAWAG